MLVCNCCLMCTNPSASACTRSFLAPSLAAPAQSVMLHLGQLLVQHCLCRCKHRAFGLAILDRGMAKGDTQDLQMGTLQAQQQLVIARVHAAVRQQADEVQRVLLERGLQPLPALVLEDVAALQFQGGELAACLSHRCCSMHVAAGFWHHASQQYIACLHLDRLVHKPCALINDLSCAQRIVPDLQHVRSSGHRQT